MSAGFTPGPWRANGGLFIKAENDWTVAEVRFPNGRGKEYREGLSYCEANARLIAAAPELYEALQVFLRLSVAGGPSDEELDEAESKARTALAKARGEA